MGIGHRSMQSQNIHSKIIYRSNPSHIFNDIDFPHLLLSLWLRLSLIRFLSLSSNQCFRYSKAILSHFLRCGMRCASPNVDGERLEWGATSPSDDQIVCNYMRLTIYECRKLIYLKKWPAAGRQHTSMKFIFHYFAPTERNVGLDRTLKMTEKP